jgi:hypothetical protein
MSRTMFIVYNWKRPITQKIGKAELQFFCNAYLSNDIYLPTKFLVDTSYNFRAMSRTISKWKKWTKGNNSKIKEGRDTDPLHSTFLLRSIYLQSSLLVPFMVSELFRAMSRTKFKVKNKLTKGINPKLGKAELWLFLHYTTVLSIRTKFKV